MTRAAITDAKFRAMSCREIQTYLAGNGFTLTVKGDKLLVSPKDKITQPIGEAIRRHKQALMDEVELAEQAAHMTAWAAIRNHL